MVPLVSVVIPARNAADTLGDTLESLMRQSEPLFEAIVVDDGSTDATPRVAWEFAERDERFQLLRGRARGVSAARNTGLAVARGPWLLFLDSDDWIEPNALELLLARANEPDGPDAVVGAWARVAPDGERSGPYRWDRHDRPVDCLATACAFPIHSCLVRRKLVSGFDESLVTCEDWELWQRLAFSGAGFALVDECVALYRMRPGAASSGGRQMLVDALEVIRRGHGPSGRDPSLMAHSRLASACYNAGLILGEGHDARPALEMLGDEHCRWLESETVALCLIGAIGLPSCCPPTRLAEVWPTVEPHLGPFLAELELRVMPGLARRTQRLLERMVLERALPESLTVGATHALHVDLAKPVEDIELGAGVERVLCRAELDGELLAPVELPACDGFVPAGVLADALAGELFWPLICRHFELEGAEAWERFIEELWGANAGVTVRAAAGWHTLEVTEPVPDIGVRGRALNVEVTVGGAMVDALQVPARRGVVRAETLRETITNECGVELAHVAVREGVVGPLPRISWPLIDEDTLVLPRWNRSCSARAALPVEAVGEFAPAALALTKVPARARYEPSLLRRQSTPSPSEPVPAPGGETGQLRILAYHRIADSGPDSLRAFRVSPSAFDEQLHRLREEGYRGVTPDEWRVASRTRRPLPGKALMITFDDGYRDFADTAWPLLERHGFTATVFVVTGAVGGGSAWDSDHGEPAPLMGWGEIRELSRRGVQFGSHTHSHRPLCGLSNADVVRELLRSRTALEEQLGEPPSAIVYPYGDFDDAIAHLAGACGYSLGFTCNPRLAELTDHPLKIPRFEVRG